MQYCATVQEGPHYCRYTAIGSQSKRQGTNLQARLHDRGLPPLQNCEATAINVTSPFESANMFAIPELNALVLGTGQQGRSL